MHFKLFQRLTALGQRNESWKEFKVAPQEKSKAIGAFRFRFITELRKKHNL